eukprot:5422089-Amphidinium_carterae.1
MGLMLVYVGPFWGVEPTSAHFTQKGKDSRKAWQNFVQEAWSEAPRKIFKWLQGKTLVWNLAVSLDGRWAAGPAVWQGEPSAQDRPRRAPGPRKSLVTGGPTSTLVCALLKKTGGPIMRYKNGSSPVDVLDQGEDEDLVLAPTEELKVMKEEDEIKFWRQMWRDQDHGLGFKVDQSYAGDSFFDRKMRAIMLAKEGEGKPVYDPRRSIYNQSLHDHLHAVLDNRKPGVADLQYRLVALSNDDKFQEQLVQWWHAIGEVIIPRLIEKRVVDQNLETLALLFQFMYKVMGTVYMKDISHVGAIGQYGDDGSAFEEGMEQIHMTDFGNRLYASVIRDGSLSDFTDTSTGFTEENKADVLETLMGLNFLEKEHRLTCQDMGITAIDDAQETMLRVEWYTFRKGLEWGMSYFYDQPVITAIVAMREACANYGLYVGERGVSFHPVMPQRRCLGCGKKRNNVTLLAIPGFSRKTCCSRTTSTRLRCMMNKWWEKRKRAFVVYVTESGHRQWPVGGIWDLEIMACALSGVFSTLKPQLVKRLENKKVTVHQITNVRSDKKPVVLEHFATLLNPRVPWWTDCEFPIECDSELDKQWTELNDRIAGQMAQYQDVIVNSRPAESNMPVIYRRLRPEMDERIRSITTQPNYGRGIPVLVCGYDLSPMTLEILGMRAQDVRREEIHRHNMAIQRPHGSYQAATKFLTTVTEEGEGVGGVLASTPAQEPQIIEQTRRKVGVTLVPGPAVTSKEFVDVDLVLEGQKPTLGKGTEDLDPCTSQLIRWKRDYLQAKGIASEGAIRYPTREFYSERFLVPSNQPLGDVLRQSLVAEGVDVENTALNSVDGLWILNGYTKKDNDGNVMRHRKILEVGPEGRPRRASLIRKAEPAKFKHDKWNGSPECLTIGATEFLAQYFYKNKQGHFFEVTDPEVLEEITLGGIGLADTPDQVEGYARNRCCGPCGGMFGQMFPCMLCENWAHVGCSYGVEGGRVCASHVAVLDAGEGLAVIISDPSGRLVGAILRPTRLYGNASSGKRPRPSKANRGENNDTEHARRWEQYAMYKSIWLAAGLQYEPRSEETGEELEQCDHGMVERLTPMDGQAWQQPGTCERRLSRALMLETTLAYLDQKVDKPTDLGKMEKQVKRRWEFTHLAHQYHATYRTAVTDVYWSLPSPDNVSDLFAKYEAGGIVDYACLKRFPSPCPR